MVRGAFGALSGLLAGFAALAVAELVAVGARPEVSPVTAVGSAAIDLTPPALKDYAVRHFGTHDKLVLQLGIVAVLGLFAVVLGVVGLRRRALGSAGVLLFGAVAAATRPVTGTVSVAGVAWAQHTGIEKVEVRVDGGPWNQARLAEQDTIDTWRQWVWPWPATAGTHTLEVRATDRSGYTQTPQRAGTVPNGATGWHSVVVTVA